MKEQDIYNTLIHTFYSSFAQKDYKTMNQCYHEDITFKDEIFELEGKQVLAMWHMLCTHSKHLHIDYDQVEVSANTGCANWNARYTFSATNRPVVNEIAVSFIFKNGLIINHQDDFDFWRWSTQALGLSGLVLGWSSFLKKKVQKQALRSLNVFISNHPEYQEKIDN